MGKGTINDSGTKLTKKHTSSSDFSSLFLPSLFFLEGVGGGGGWSGMGLWNGGQAVIIPTLSPHPSPLDHSSKDY